MSIRVHLSVDEALSKSLNRRLDTIRNDLDRKTRLKLIRPTAKDIFAEAARKRAPKSRKRHFRYDKSGKRVAAYFPGNLKRSIKPMVFRKSWSVFVGPKYAKTTSGGSGIFIGNRVDGWYGHFLEFGTDRGISKKLFMWRAYNASLTKAKIKTIRTVDRHIKNRAKQLKLA